MLQFWQLQKTPTQNRDFYIIRKVSDACVGVFILGGVKAMGNQDVDNTNKEKMGGGYQFVKLPENIRQMGEPPMQNRIYIEDYVMTYMHQIFQKKRESAIVVLLGKKGEKEAENAVFVYGAVEVELDLLSGSQNFNAETWDKIYEVLYEHFKGAEVLGWGLGVSMWNSRIDSIVHQVQEKHFAKEGMVVFLEDLSEKEEKIFCWQAGKLAELSGYIIYYEKNPQMQDYMLLGQPKKSFEAAYEDKVTATVRNVVHRNTEQGNPKKIAFYSAGVFLVLLTILGANLLVQSTKKIDSLEKTIETLSNAATGVTEAPAKKVVKKTDKQEKKNTGRQKETDKTEGKGKQGETAGPAETEKAKASAAPQETETARQTAPPALTDPALTKSAAATPPSLQAASTASPSAEKSSRTPKKTTEKSSQTPKPDNKAAQAVKRSASSYVVQSGDTLSQIVWRHYHTLSCMEMVKNANKIKNCDAIKEGQKLYLPAYP